MADFYMHRLLIEALKPFTDGSDESVIGAQGPDYFYYVLGSNKPQAQRLGHLIHHEQINHFLVNLLKSAKAHDSVAMLHYLYGFLSHHALDISIHPYIFHYSGVYQENDPKTHHWAGLHLQFERKVDIAFIQNERNIKPHKHKLHQTTLPLKSLPDAVQTAISEAVDAAFNIPDAGPLFNQGYQTMRKVGRLLVYDPLKIKRNLLGWVESYKKPKSTYFQDLSHAQNIQDFDYLNLKKTPWKHPVTGEAMTSSVPEMFELALKRSQAFIQAAQEAFDQNDPEILAQALPDASYDTGLKWDENQPMTHFTDYRTLVQKK